MQKQKNVHNSRFQSLQYTIYDKTNQASQKKLTRKKPCGNDIKNYQETVLLNIAN